MSINTKSKDRFFKKLFSEKKDLLSLYNAINLTDYTDPDMIEVNTIEDFIFMTMKNDLSFIVADMLNLYEQQSTPNPNMPLRGFLYLAELYRKKYKGDTDLYSSRMIPLPTPQFIVFYIGERDESDAKTMRMSDAYIADAVYCPAIECTAILLNINYGHNQKLMEKCEKLRGYSILNHKVRENIAQNMTKEEAVEKAVDECIEEGILKDILSTHRSEATTMILEEYDEARHIQNEKEISYEDGLNQGREEGRNEALLQAYWNCIKQGMTTEEAKAISGITDDLLTKVEQP